MLLKINIYWLPNNALAQKGWSKIKSIMINNASNIVLDQVSACKLQRCANDANARV